VTGSRRALLTAVAAALSVALAAADIVLWLNGRHAAAVERSRSQAVSAARQAARDILSYDYRSLQADIAKAKSETTGLFAKQYAGSADTLLAQAAQLRAIVQATPASPPAIVSATADEVVVLVFIDQASVKQPAGQKTPATRIDQSRVRMTMTKVGGAWKVSQLAAL
jgi:Mce-associated membrane protein